MGEGLWKALEGAGSSKTLFSAYLIDRNCIFPLLAVNTGLTEQKPDYSSQKNRSEFGAVSVLILHCKTETRQCLHEKQMITRLLLLGT